MAHRDAARDWLPLRPRVVEGGAAPTGEAFRTEWISFTHGIRVGRLEPHERITRILRYHLEQRYGTPFVTDRWGRGVYWQWICWLPRANREAKPVSHAVNFGCAKLFITADRDSRVFRSGLQVERGYTAGRGGQAGWRLQADWDWHRLMQQCWSNTPLDRDLRRLLRDEGFVAEIGAWDAKAVFRAANYRSARQIRSAAGDCAAREWVGFQLYYPMPEKEVRACTGHELVKAVCAVFDAVMPAMNACMQVSLRAREPAATGRA